MWQGCVCIGQCATPKSSKSLGHPLLVHTKCKSCSLLRLCHIHMTAALCVCGSPREVHGSVQISEHAANASVNTHEAICLLWEHENHFIASLTWKTFAFLRNICLPIHTPSKPTRRCSPMRLCHSTVPCRSCTCTLHHLPHVVPCSAPAPNRAAQAVSKSAEKSP